MIKWESDVNEGGIVCGGNSVCYKRWRYLLTLTSG